MKNILEAPFMVEMIRTVTNMYAHGWDERNGGNVSLMLDEADVKDYLDLNNVKLKIPTGFTAPELEAFKSSLNDRVTEALRENAKLRKVVDQIKAAASVEIKDATERVDASKVASDIMEAIDDVEPEEDEKTEE